MSSANRCKQKRTLTPVSCIAVVWLVLITATVSPRLRIVLLLLIARRTAVVAAKRCIALTGRRSRTRH